MKRLAPAGMTFSKQGNLRRMTRSEKISEWMGEYGVWIECVAWAAVIVWIFIVATN